MARFRRTVPAPTLAAKKNYTAYRPYIQRDFEECCAYCLRHEDWAEAETFELDHLRPQSLFPEDKYNFYNLYYACRRCNLRKLDYYPSTALIAAGVGFVDYCQRIVAPTNRIRPLHSAYSAPQQRLSHSAAAFSARQRFRH